MTKLEKIILTSLTKYSKKNPSKTKKMKILKKGNQITRKSPKIRKLSKSNKKKCNLFKQKIMMKLV